uniref:Transmembrane protein n=1 Tax=Steinernema glaseri TaxID=37863 RepID=A0A1I8AUP1_9BILA
MKARPDKAQVSVEMEADVGDSCCFGILNIKSGTIVFGVIWALISIITLCISIPSSDIPVTSYSIAVAILGIVVVVPLFMGVWTDRPLLLIPFAITLILYLVLTLVTTFHLIRSLTYSKENDSGERTFAIASLGLLAAIVLLDAWSLAVLKQCFTYLKMMGMVPHSVLLP